MNATRFPTEQTEHEKYYMQIDFYKHRHISVSEEASSGGQNFRSFFDESGAEAVSQAREQLFNYERRTEEVDHQIQIPYHGNIDESYSNNFNTQDMRDLFDAMRGVESLLEGDAAGVIDSIISSSSGGDKLGSMRQPLEGLRGESFNEQTQVYFDNPEFRSYNFEFTLIPRNVKDAKRMMAIRDIFRYHASPGLSNSGLNWTYPSMVRFKFIRNEVLGQANELVNRSAVGKGGTLQNNNNLFRSKMCAIESVNFTYGDEQYREFYDDESDQYFPALIRLAIQLKEVEHWVRDVGHGGDFSTPRTG